MKLTTLILITVILHVSASSLAQKITLSEKNAPLVDVFNQISNQTGYDFLFTGSDLKNARPVTINVKNEELNYVLSKIFAGQPLAFTIENNSVVVQQKTQSPLPDKITTVINTPVTTSGKVTDTTGTPLQGATIAIKGKNISVVTTADGAFNINAQPGDQILISFIGYVSQTINVTDNPSFQNIILHSLAAKLSEVSVISTGYQTISKERATGSYDQIDNKLLSRSTSSNILDRINGVASGVRFNGTASQSVATDPASRQLGINIRGASTLSNQVGEDPLIVLDNFPYEGNISNINPNDIESITILKDAAAASIWGARSGNGVIVITTKKGRLNQPLSVDFNSTLIVVNKPNLFYDRDFLPSSDYIQVETDLFKKGYFDSYLNDTQDQSPVSPVVDLLNREKQGQISPTDAAAQINNLQQNDVRKDFEKYVYRKAVQQQYSLGLRGGSTNDSYTFSAGYDDNQNALVKNNFNRFTLNALNTYQPLKNLELTTAINYSENTTRLNNNVAYGNINVGGPVSGVYPYARFADAQGNHLSIVKDYRASYADNAVANGFQNWNYVPLDELNLEDDNAKVEALMLRASLRYKIAPFLNIEAQYEREHQVVDTRNYQGPQTYAARNFYNEFTLIDPSTKAATYQAPYGGLLDLGYNDLVSQNSRIQANFNKRLGNKSELTALAGAEIRQVAGSATSQSDLGYDDKYGTAATGLDYSDYFQTSPNGYAQLPSPDGDVRKTLNRFVSYFSNLAYSYDNIYTVSLSGRKDGANIFGVKTNDKITPLWSAGLGYNIANAGYYNIPWLPILKLRATYGFNGNVYNGSAYVTGVYSVSSLTGAQQILNLTAPNPELSWEKVKNVNIGVDFATKASRISGTIEYYIKDGVDLIENVPLATSTGFAAFTGNAASTQTHGLDISINTRNIVGAFGWNTSLLFSTLKDKVTNYNINYTSASIQSNPSVGIPSVGKSLYGIYSYKWGGLDPATGDPQGYLNGKISKDYAGIINNYKPDSLVYNGSGRPTVYGSLRNDFTFRNLTLSANIGFEFGYVFRRSSTSINEADLISTAYSQNIDYEQRWQKPGDELKTSVPSVIYPSDNNRNTFYQYSQALVSNASNIRLLDLRLSYSIDQKQWRNCPFKSLQLFSYASNLGIIWRANKYGIDPDLPAFQTHVYPNPFSISVGFNAHF